MNKTLLVIPHYNDTQRLAPFLSDLVEVLPSNFAILVSDDGSDSDQRERLKQLNDKYTTSGSENGPSIMTPIYVEKNTGKGGAVRRGWDYGKNHDFSLIVFADADGAISAKEVVRAEQYFRQNLKVIDVLFGSRVMMLGRTVTRSLKRHLSGRVFATVVSILGKVPAYDTQCGLKILKKEVYLSIRPYLRTDGFAFDVELCLLLLAKKWRIQEFPIDWHDMPESKVSLVRDGLRMAVEAIKITRRIKNFQ